MFGCSYFAKCLLRKNVIISLKHDICDFFRCKEKYVVNESSVADPDPLGSEQLLFGSGSEQKSLGSATHLHTRIYILYAICSLN